MIKIEWLPRPGLFPWDFAWQSTVILAIGLVVTAMLQPRPARAHRLLLLIVIASLFAPVMSRLAHSVRLGSVPLTDSVHRGCSRTHDDDHRPRGGFILR